MHLTVVDPVHGYRTDMVLEADGQTPVSEIAKELLTQIGSPPGHQPPFLYVDGALVDPAQALGDSPLREGTVVSLNSPAGCPPGEPQGVVELRVIGGPGSGAVHRLGIGRAEIGGGPGVAVKINDPELQGRALTLRVTHQGTCNVTVHKPYESTIDGEPCATEERLDWPMGSQLTVGRSLLELIPYFPPDAALRASQDGTGLDYNRPPRLLPPERPTKFRLPKEPSERERRAIPWLMATLPVVGAVMMAWLRDRWIFLLIAFLGPIMVIGNYFVDKKKGRKSYAKKMAEYREHKGRIEADAKQALRAESYARRHAAPDPAAALTMATGPRTRLWERRRTDDDHLLLRVGTHEMESEVTLYDPNLDEHKRDVVWKLADAPVTMPLRHLGIVGFAGAGDSARAMGRWAVGQLAVLHSPLDVQFYLLTDPGAQQDWEWMRWLPHARPSSGQDISTLFGIDAETVGSRIAELTSVLDQRQEARKRVHLKSTYTDPDIVMVLDGSRRIRSLPGMIRLLREGPEVSIFAICLDTEERFLPAECQGVAIAESPAAQGGWPFHGGQPAAPVPGFGPPAPGAQPNGGQQHSGWGQHGFGAPAAGSAQPETLRVEQRGSDRRREVRPDWVSVQWCEIIGRAMAPLRDISEESEESTLPSSSRLLDVLQMEPPTVDAVSAVWRVKDQSTMAVIGESHDGPFGIDLRRDGPHGLIAGTTGSGKSELLQTIVASLAVANSPENMTFVLIDYKGGSAFKDCVQLPHTVGMVTDLDNHLVERALRSLGAELTRREHILADVGAKDIEDYQDLRRREPGQHLTMPRLLIVIDEFASMVRELPDFVKGLVNIAQRGRSLGIHLLLATQRPSGVVSPEIRANTNLRIALRVTDNSESNDVISAPDASSIPKTAPGRAYARLSAASLVPFQSGRVGGRRPGAADPALPEPWSERLDWFNLGRPRPTPPKLDTPEEDTVTDLTVLVEAIVGANQRLGIPQQHSPWLPPLADKVLLSELASTPGAGTRLPAVAYGVEDLPEQQERRPLRIDFSTFGHLLVGGAPRTGRSQLLRTIAGSLTAAISVDDLHLYGIDCGNGALNALTRLPHCGAVVSRSQVERAKRLVRRLQQELSRRQEILANDALADIGEQRAAAAPDQRLPHIVVLLDRWEGWTTTLGEIDHGALTDDLYLLLREGASVGIHLIVTGDRSVLAGRISGMSEEKYTFRLQDRADYTTVGINGRKLPEEIPPGRMYRGVSGREIQVAVLAEDTTGQAQAAAIASIAEHAAERDNAVPRSRRPFRVDVLPARLTFPAAWEMRDADTSDSRLWSLIGVGGDELTGYGPDLAKGTPAFVVAGPPKSGRSSVLLNIAESLLMRGTRLVVCTPRLSPLRSLEGRDGVVASLTGGKLTGSDVTEAMQSATPDDPIVLLMDDGEDLRKCDGADELRAVITRGAEAGTGLILAGDAEDVCSGYIGWQPEVKKARRGVLLSPRSHRHGDLIGVKLARSAAVESVQPGSGIVHLGDGVPLSVRIPMPVEHGAG